MFPDVRWLLVSTLLAVQGFVAPSAAAQAAPGLFWLPGPDGSGEASVYAGAIDQPANGATQSMLQPIVVSGWVVDTTAQGWNGIDDVQVWDAPMELSGHKLASASIQLSRPDVAAALGHVDWTASGFSATISAGGLIAGPAFWYVYVHTPSKGWWYTQTEVVLSGAAATGDPRLELETPTVLATIHGGLPFTVRGYAIDRNAAPNQGIGVDRVDVYFNGDRRTGLLVGQVTPGESNALAAANGPQFGNAGWHVTFQPTSWVPGLMDNQFTSITVYAHSSVTGRETQVTRQVTMELP